MRLPHIASLCAAVFAFAACSGGGEPADSTPSSTGAPQAATAGEQTPDPGGSIISVEMLTDDQGNNIFRPAEIEAKQGDVLRYTLVSGVHNVHFLADSNANATGLPAAGDMLQAPGQTWDVKVSMAPGRYYFQCDPHALLGMVGYLNVQPVN